MILDHQETWAFKEYQAKLELLDHQGNEETLVNQDLRETEDHLVLLDFREHPVIRENLALKVLPD